MASRAGSRRRLAYGHANRSARRQDRRPRPTACAGRLQVFGSRHRQGRRPSEILVIADVRTRRLLRGTCSRRPSTTSRPCSSAFPAILLLDQVRAFRWKDFFLRCEAEIIASSLSGAADSLIETQTSRRRAALADRIAPEHLDCPVEGQQACLPNLKRGRHFLGRWRSSDLATIARGRNHVSATAARALLLAARRLRFARSVSSSSRFRRPRRPGSESSPRSSPKAYGLTAQPLAQMRFNDPDSLVLPESLALTASGCRRAAHCSSMHGKPHRCPPALRA